MEIGKTGEAVLAICFFGVFILLFIAVPVCVNYLIFRYSGRLMRDGVRLPAVVIRVTRCQDANSVSFRYTSPDRGHAVERQEEWHNPDPLPAVGDTVMVLCLPGRWRWARLEANARVAPQV